MAGVLAIARFNWPFYLAAIGIVLASGVGAWLFDSRWPRLLCACAAAGAGFFLLCSLGASHLIYDRSDLYRWNWLKRALRGVEVHRAIFCHSGFDETSMEVRAQFPGSEWMVLDHYNPAHMTESSILRARSLFPPTLGTRAAAHDHWPVASEYADVIFGLLAIHELRSDAERRAWFTEARRCLRREGRVLLAEHLRDWANFAAFGPGFLHFHSRRNWRDAWTSGGLRCLQEFRVTPWVRIFVLGPAG